MPTTSCRAQSRPTLTEFAGGVRHGKAALQARLTPLEFAQFLLSRSEITSSAGSLMAAADTFAPVDAGGATRRPAAVAAAASAVASFLRAAATRPP